MRFVIEQSSRGVVYIHCKIGYSRSAAVVCAWVLATGRAGTVAEAVAVVRRARPQVIVRPEALQVRSPPRGGGLRARVLVRRDLGPVHLIRLRLADGSSVKVRQADQVDAAVGEEVEIELARRHLFVYPAGD